MKILPKFGRLSFNFVDGFLCCAKAFKFNWISVVYFCFHFFALGDRLKKYIAMSMSKSVPPLSFSRSFIVLGEWLHF